MAPGRAAQGARGPGAVHMAGRGGSGVCGDLGYPALLAPHMEELVQADARRLGGPLPVQGTCLGVGLPWVVTGHALTSGACGCRSPWPARPSRSSLKARPPSIGPPPPFAGCVQDGMWSVIGPGLSGSTQTSPPRPPRYPRSLRR